jgi:ornithine cyclodeaminase/alanine dehydrogenase
MKTLLLTRNEVEPIATMKLAVEAVEEAFAVFGRGEADMPPKVYLSIEDHDGDFRAMPSRLGDSAGIKWVNVHPHNEERYGLPSVMGVYVLNDPTNAFPLAIMDGTSLTALRTGAAAGVASKYLYEGTPTTLGLIGCGVQAHTLLGAHEVVFGKLEVLAYDLDPDTASTFACAVGGRSVSLEDAAGADVVCTATPARIPFLEGDWVRPGAHVNAMGADAPGKQEVAVELLRRAAIYIDDVHQATGSGEINVPLASGELALEDLAGTLGEVVAGSLPKPTSDVTTLFDSTGLAVQDVALARAIYDEARARGVGHEVDLLGLHE